MNKRDYFAAQAMQAIIAKMPFNVADLEDSVDIDFIFEMVARGAYAYADAMMGERKENI